MISIVTILPLAPCFATLLILGYVIGQRRHTDQNRSYLLFSANLFFLTLVDFVTRLPLENGILQPGYRISITLLFLLGASFLNLITSLTGRRRGVLFRVIMIILAVPVAASLAVDTVAIGPAGGGMSHMPLPLPAFAAMFVVGSLFPAIYSIVLLTSALATSKGIIRQQIVLLSWGTTLASVYELLVIIVFPMALHRPGTIHYAAAGIFIFALFIWWAVRRYHLFSVNIEQIEEVSGRLFNDLRQAIFLFDENGRCIQSNRFATELFGREVREASEIAGVIDGFALGRVSDELRTTGRGSGGRELVLLVTQSPVRQGPRSAGSIVVVSDITEQTRTENELVRSRQIESLGVLAAGIAHDFSNFLSGIAVSISLVKHDQGISIESREILADGELAAQKAARLTRDLLNLSTGGPSAGREACDLAAIINETVRLGLRGSPVTADVRLAPDLRGVDGDRTQLCQVFQNLVINAVQAMAGAGVITVTGRNIDQGDQREWQLSPGAYVEIVVADTGPGVPDDIIGKMFEPYFTTKQKGSGLGLATAYSIVRRHGGQIKAASPGGTGAVFSVVLPSAAHSSSL